MSPKVIKIKNLLEPYSNLDVLSSQNNLVHIDYMFNPEDLMDINTAEKVAEASCTRRYSMEYCVNTKYVIIKDFLDGTTISKLPVLFTEADTREVKLVRQRFILGCQELDKYLGGDSVCVTLPESLYKKYKDLIYSNLNVNTLYLLEGI